VIANHYKVVKYLGGGAFGDVYLVEDLHLAGELFALKVLKLGGAEGDEKRRQRFLGEARVLLKLVHPSIVMMGRSSRSCSTRAAPWRSSVRFSGLARFSPRSL
jgi:serine/threonine protein kinase